MLANHCDVGANDWALARIVQDKLPAETHQFLIQHISSTIMSVKDIVKGLKLYVDYLKSSSKKFVDRTKTDPKDKFVSQSHDFHRSSSAMAEKSQIAVFVRNSRELFPISGLQ